MALDLGDVWTGVALSDESATIAAPAKTIKQMELIKFLKNYLKNNLVEKIIVGFPKTMSGGVSQQTEKTVQIADMLKKELSGTEIILWDERLSSKHAARSLHRKDKSREHEVAAALILQSYLDYLAFHKN